MANKLLFYGGDEIRSVQLSVEACRPLGWAKVQPDIPALPARTLASALGHLGAERLPRRYPVMIESQDIVTITDIAERLLRRGPYFDVAWILMHAVRQELGGNENDCCVGLLTRPQLSGIIEQVKAGECILDNGRCVQTVGADSILDGLTLEQQGARYKCNLGFDENELTLITTPSNPYADLLRSTHSYFCVLNPQHRKYFTSSYIAVRNVFLEQDFPGLHAVVPVRPIFDPRVKLNRIVLDSTTHAAIGLPQGEPVSLAPARGRPPRTRSAIFGNRNCVARTGRTATVDIEKPITRLPREMLDVLDINENERVVAESVRVTPDGYEVTRTTLRALPQRDRSPLLIARTKAGVPDYQELVGDEDFPTISLDLVTRERLGISPGTAVYLRPAISSELTRQFASVSLALVAAVVSAAILRNTELALAMSGLYVILTIFVIARRLRQ